MNKNPPETGGAETTRACGRLVAPRPRVEEGAAAAPPHGATARVARREFLAAAAGAAAAGGLAGCGKTRVPEEPRRAAILRAPEYDQRIYQTVRDLLARFRFKLRGRNVLLKPNLVEFEPQSYINTHPMLVHAAYEGFRELGANVRIAEGPGHRRNTLDLADAAGYFDAVPRFEDVFVDLNLDDVSRVHPKRQISGLREWYLPNAALGADLLVSMPKMKTHHWVGVTLSAKNLFGVVPGGVYGWPKNPLHWAGIEESIADLHGIFPRQFAIVDGIVGMEGNGPIQGKAKRVGVIVAGDDRVAVDATCCRVMGIDPWKVRYLRLATATDFEIMETNVRQIGESISAVATPFALIPEFDGIRLESRS